MRNVSCRRIRRYLTRVKASIIDRPSGTRQRPLGPGIVMIRQGSGCDLNVEAFDALFDAINGQIPTSSVRGG